MKEYPDWFYVCIGMILEAKHKGWRDVVRFEIDTLKMARDMFLK